MIVRQSVRCKLCNQDHTLRISIGSGKTQSHSFNCVQCEQPLSIYFEKNYNDASFHGHRFENCEPSTVEGAIVNLHPDFIIPADKVHQDAYFQSIETIMQFKDNILEKLLQSSDDLTEKTKKYYEGLRQKKSLHDNADLLELGSKLLALYASGKIDVANQVLANEIANYGLPDDISVDDLIDVVCALGGARAKKVRVALEELWDAANSNNAAECEKAWSYLEREHNEEFVRSFSNLLTAFSKSHRSFLPVIHHLRVFGQLSDDASVSSIDFEETKMMYGNIYEVATAAFVLPAVFNNVANGRAYDVFERLTLKEYLNLDKSGRHNCFASKPALSILSENLDNQLRNASHHQSISMNAKTGRISFKAGKSSTRRSMSYADYLAKTFLLLEIFLGLMSFIVTHRRRLSPPNP